MSLSAAYLTIKQRQIWELKSNGLPEASIARKLEVSRQSIHKAVTLANRRVAKSLQEAAYLNKIEIQILNPKRGFLAGYSPHFQTQAFVTFSAKNGIQIWYKHEGNCQECSKLQQCRSMLITEANERNCLLTDDVESIMPTKLADVLFTKIAGEKINGT